ncbi:MAG TPA: hypothetical protein VIJ28_14215 [Chloroflexota bacterium]|jgi:hypothetical protein
MSGKLPGPAPAREPDLYVLFRVASAARYPFLADWVTRRRLSAGFHPAHAGRFARVLVIGAPDGLVLPPTCRVAYVPAEEADRRFADDPEPSIFGGNAR